MSDNQFDSFEDGKLPYFGLRLHPDGKVDMKFLLPDDTPIENFTRVMEMLVNRKLNPYLKRTILQYGLESGRLQEASLINSAFSRHKENKDWDWDGEEPPAISPSKVIKHILKGA